MGEPLFFVEIKFFNDDAGKLNQYLGQKLDRVGMSFPYFYNLPGAQTIKLFTALFKTEVF